MALISPENWIKRIDDTIGLTLQAGTYVAGTLLVEVSEGVFGLANVAFDSTTVNDAQRVYVLRDAVTTATDGTAGVGVIGEFNATAITFNGTQTAVTLAGVLQAKGIFLKTWLGA